MASAERPDKRTERSRATRARIAAAAQELFLQRGYGATNLQDVAAHAGVAVQTIYFSFGNKRAVLKEVVDTAIAGDDKPIATMDRAWFTDAMNARTAESQLRRHIHGTREILDRVAPIVELLAIASATDPEVAQLWPDGIDPRYTVQSAAAAALIGKPGARTGVTAKHAADLLFGLLSPALYLVFVRDRGWSPQKWEKWVFDTLRPQLCAP